MVREAGKTTNRANRLGVAAAYRTAASGATECRTQGAQSRVSSAEQEKRKPGPISKPGTWAGGPRKTAPTFTQKTGAARFPVDEFSEEDTELKHKPFAGGWKNSGKKAQGPDRYYQKSNSSTGDILESRAKKATTTTTSSEDPREEQLLPDDGGLAFPVMVFANEEATRGKSLHKMLSGGLELEREESENMLSAFDRRAGREMKPAELSKREIEALLPECYLKKKKNLIFHPWSTDMKKFEEATLFYAFYNVPADMYQLNAAKEL